MNFIDNKFRIKNAEKSLLGVAIGDAFGDRDTICAMVGGMSIMSSKTVNIPNAWMTSVEQIDKSIFRQKK